MVAENLPGNSQRRSLTRNVSSSPSLTVPRFVSPVCSNATAAVVVVSYSIAVAVAVAPRPRRVWYHVIWSPPSAFLLDFLDDDSYHLQTTSSSLPRPSRVVLTALLFPSSRVSSFSTVFLCLSFDCPRFLCWFSRPFCLLFSPARSFYAIRAYCRISTLVC